MGKPTVGLGLKGLLVVFSSSGTQWTLLVSIVLCRLVRKYNDILVVILTRQFHCCCIFNSEKFIFFEVT